MTSVNRVTTQSPPAFRSSADRPQIPAARPFFILAIDLCISISDGGSHEIVVDGVALVAASIRSLDIGAGGRFNRLL